MIKFFKRMSRKETDRQVDAIFDKDIKQPLEDTAKTAKKISRMLEKNGVSLHIVIASGGDRNAH